MNNNKITANEALYNTKMIFGLLGKYILNIIRETHVCFDKCVKRFNEKELQPSEMTCLDRCSKKFYDLYSNVLQDMVEKTNQ